MSRRWWGSRYVFIEESFSHRRWRVLFKRKIFRCQLPQHKKKETNTEQCRQQSSLAVEHGRNYLKNCYPPPSFAGGLHQRFAFSSAVLILLSITAFLTNSLILVALHKEHSLHPPSKLLHRSLAITDLLVGLVQEHWSLCRYDVKPVSLLLEDKWSKTSNEADNQTSTLLSMELDHLEFYPIVLVLSVQNLYFFHILTTKGKAMEKLTINL